MYPRKRSKLGTITCRQIVKVSVALNRNKRRVVFKKILKPANKDSMRNFATQTPVEKYSVHALRRQKVFSVVIVSNFINMKNILGFRFLSAAIVFSCVRGENDEDCKEAHEQRGFCLLNHEYKEIQANSMSQCYMNCAKESSCHSVNFFSGATKKCEMNRATRATRPEDYTSCADSTYMENVVRGITLYSRYS